MRIGIDFDNTIACYDGVFHAAALTRGLIPADLPTHRTAVRDYLNGNGRERDFTELQGYVYGARMDLAKVYPGFLAFVEAARLRGHDLFIISHKSAIPLAGPVYDLRAAAKGFLRDSDLVAPNLIDERNIHFEDTQRDKIAKIAVLGCDLFIDDLPDVLSNPSFPGASRAILFDPDGVHASSSHARIASWDEASQHLLTAAI